MTSKTTRQTAIGSPKTTPAGIPNESTPLNMRQLGFCRNFVSNGGQAGKAYLLAGYSANGADQSAHALLRNPQIQAEIASIRNDVEIEATVDRSFVVANLRENVARAMQAVPVLDRDGNETGEYKYQGSVANRSLELLGKTLGMFVEVLDVHTTFHDSVAALEAEHFTFEELRFMRDEMHRRQSAIEVAAKVLPAETSEEAE